MLGRNISRSIVIDSAYPITGRTDDAPVPAFGIADDFNRANSTSLGSTPTGGKAWTEQRGDWQIASNKCNLASVAGGFSQSQIASVDSERADLFVATAHCDLAGTAELIGLAIRMADADNGWLIELYSGINQCSIVEVTAGVRAYRAGVAQSPALDHVTEYLLTAEVSGDTINCYTDAHGGSPTNYASASANNDKTVHGLYGFNGVTNGNVNDFELAEL